MRGNNAEIRTKKWMLLCLLPIFPLIIACNAADDILGIHAPFIPGNSTVPTPTVTATLDTVPFGGTTTLTAAGSGTDAVYSWVVSGGGTVEAAGETVTFTAASTVETVTISCFASIEGYLDSDPAAVSISILDFPILTPPVITLDEGTSTVFINSSSTLSASGSEFGAIYNWSVTGSGSISATGTQVTFSATANEETITVSCYASLQDYNDSPVSSAVINVKANYSALLTYDNTGTNINTPAATAIAWNASSYNSTYFAHSTSVNPERLTVNQNGDYLVALTIPMQTAVERSSVRARVFVNGTPFTGAITESSYIRNNVGNHSESSDHLALLLQNLSASDYLEVYVIAAAVAGTVNITGKASLYVEFVEPARTIFSATATQTTSSTNVNQATAFALEWTETVKDAGFTHSNVSITEDILLDTAGYYLVFANMPLSAGGAARYNVRLIVELNGSTVPGGEAKQGFIRGTGGHQNASVHWSGIVYSSGANLPLRIKTQQEASAGAVTVGGNSATIFIEKLDTSSFIYSGEATTLTGGNNWNPPSAESIQWQQDNLVDANTFTHSTSINSHQITLDKSGDYLVVYNDSLLYSFTVPGSPYRFNPKIRIQLDGSPVPGAETKSHYIRNDVTGNFESSGSLVFYLAGVSAGQILSVTAEQEAETNPVDDDENAILLIIRRQ